MFQITIRRGMYGDGFNTEVAARAKDPQSDLAAIGDHDFFEHVPAFQF
jgi:hypothetical protein